MQNNSKNRWSFKDKLEITESIFTIIVSVMAIWGTVVAWQNGFWHKLERITDHLHKEIVTNKDFRSADHKLHQVIHEASKKI